MTQMLDLPQTIRARNALRLELKDYLILHSDQPWMWTMMEACQEIDPSDIAALQVGYVPLAPRPGPDTALAVFPYTTTGSADVSAMPTPPTS